MSKNKTREKLQSKLRTLQEEDAASNLRMQNEELKERLREAEEVLRAIRSGQIDALAVSDAQGERIYTLESADRAYRTLIETMSEGALTLSPDGSIFYANNRIEEMLGVPLATVVGSHISDFVLLEDRESIEALLRKAVKERARGEIRLVTANGAVLPASLSVNGLEMGGASALCMVISDLSEEKRTQEELSRYRDHLERLVEEQTRQILEKSEHLEEVNVALRVVLQQREDDRKELEESVVSNIKNLILPYVEKLNRSALSSAQRAWVEILESHAYEITSTFGRTLALRFSDLSPSELRVAALIRDGRTTREIAKKLGISQKTVACHRDRIRGKLDLRGGRANLRTVLLDLT